MASDRLYSRLQEEVIRDGTDQCCAAMRRMVNRREYRRHKKEMTEMEKQQFDESRIDLREIRLDKLIQEVEAFIKNAGDILLERPHQFVTEVKLATAKQARATEVKCLIPH